VSRAAAKRPYAICHMVASVDRRILTTGWPLPKGLFTEYERTAASFQADAWIIGRASMEPHAGKAEEAAPRSRTAAWAGPAMGTRDLEAVGFDDR
jgi:hypothetical protein